MTPEPPMADPSPVVVYPVATLLKEISDEVKDISKKLDAKLDRTDFADFRRDVEDRFTRLETARVQDKHDLEGRIGPLELGWAKLAGAVMMIGGAGGGVGFLVERLAR